MNKIQLRPEHIPHILRIFEVEPGYEKALIKQEYSNYSRKILLKKIDLFSRSSLFEIVPSIDVLCESCFKKENCDKSDADLFKLFNEDLRNLPKDQQNAFLKNTLQYLKKEIGILADAFPFTHLIGECYTLDELYHIQDNPDEILLKLSSSMHGRA